MIQLYPKGQTSFASNGIELHPSENEVNWQEGGRYDFSMTIPREMADGIELDYGMILKVSVPPQHVGAISLGTVSYYETTAETPMYSQIPSTRTVKYNPWTLKGYTAGEKVSYGNKNYSANHAIAPLTDVAPSVSSDWTEIPRTAAVPGKELATLASGTSIMKVKDFSAEYMEAATLTGLQGYIKISDCTATGQSGQRTIPAFDIDTQYFTISHIDKETDRHSIRIEAEHISYQLGRTILGECNVVGVSPATALLFIAGAMQEEYSGSLYCGSDVGDITADWSWKNAQAAILDPQNGLLKAIAAKAIRDNLDVYIVPDLEGDPTYEVRYGVNMKNIKWTGDITDIVTRVYPIAQNEDGSRMMLPEKYVDSTLEVPYVRPEVLDTKLKVGTKVENSDGTEVELTESEVITRMRQAAGDRFSIDHCDQAEVTLELDWIHMPDTEEYKQYLTLANATPGDWVSVVDGPMGVNQVIQLTSYVWDAILLKYKKTGFGNKKQRPSVSGYDLKSGAVSGRAIAGNAVGSEHLQAGSVTAREIAANSITADQIASKIITASLIAAGAIRADAIDTNDLTAIQATLQIANIADARIGVADIGYAQIKDANVQNLIAKDALTDRYFIDKLQVRNLQSVYATVGELVVKAANDNYYKLTIDENGEIVTTQVTPTSAEIAAGVTSDGHAAIIETDLTVQDLAATNVKGINALIDKLSASRINVDELFARQAFINKLNTTDIESTANLTIKTGGTFSVQSGNFSIDSSGNVSMTGTINAGAGGKIAGWDINAASLTGNKTGIAKTTNDTDIAFWAGNATAGSANFRVTQGGKVTLRDLVVLDEQGNESTVDLRNYPLWKLSYATVKSITVDQGTGAVTIVTTAGSYSFNRGSGGSVTLSGSWTDNWTKYTVVATDGGGNVIGTQSSGAVMADKTSADIKSDLEASSSHTTTLDIEADGETLVSRTINASGVFAQGEAAGWNDGYDDARDYISMPGAGTGTSFTVGIPNAARTGQETHTFTITKGTPSASGGYAAVSYNNGAVCRIALDDWWSGGAASVTVSSITRNSNDQHNNDHTISVYAKATASNGATKNQTLTVDATTEYNGGWSGCYATVGLDSTTETTLGYGASVTVYAQAKSSSGASSKTNVTSRKINAPAAVTISSITRNSNDQHNNDHTISVYAKATASNGATKNQTLTVDATTEYNGGWSGCYNTVGLNSTSETTLSYGASVTVYAQAKASSGASSKTNVASRTITAPADRVVTSTASISYNSSTHKYVATGKAYKDGTEVDSHTSTSGTQAYDAGYNAGWNACLTACGITGGGYVRTGGTYYSSLYIMGQSGPQVVGSGYVGVNSVYVAAK